MALIRIDRFGGLSPANDPRKLPEGGAQEALNCLLEMGDIQPVLIPTVVGPSLGVNATRIFQWKTKWFAWTGTVHVCNTPVAQDQWERLYWTRGGSNKPKFAINNDLQQASPNLSNAGTDLGIAPPASKPGVQVSGSVAPSAEASGIAQTSPARVTVAGGHPFKSGQRVVVSFERAPNAPQGTPETPPDRTGMVEIMGEEYVVKSVENASGNPDANVFDLIGANAADYSEYEPDRWRATFTRVYSVDDTESRSYVYTLVSLYGEESQPSPPSDVVDIIDMSSVAVTAPVPPGLSGYRVRLYRTATGTSGTNYFFVKEVAATAPSVTITDDVKPESLGEMLPSETWAMPPAGLTGLTAMPNGFFAAFKGKTLYFCEPYQPHAWPIQYTRTTQDDIVGLSVYGQTLVVATTGKPYIATGTDPASMSMSQMDVYAPCINERSIASSGAGVLYATADGVVHITQASADIITARDFTKFQWEPISAQITAAAFHDGRYHLASFGHLHLFEVLDGRLVASRVAQSAGCLAVSTATANGFLADSLHMAVGPSLYVFNRGGGWMTAKWSSGTITMRSATTLACGQVFAENYPVTLKLVAGVIGPGGQPEPIQWPVTSSKVVTVTVNGPEPFRLPSGFMAREWRVDVETSRRVQAIHLASSMDELKQA